MSNKLFSVFSWNVEHFGQNSDDAERKQRQQRVATAIKDQDPDIMAIYEVSGKEVFWEFTTQFREYSFFITEGEQTQEILIGVKRHLQVFVTQRTEFKASNPFLRPGVLVTIVTDQGNYSLLFLHLKSMTSPYGWGLRDLMWENVRSLKKKIDSVSDNPKFIVLGDLNTMGMNYTYGDKDISGEEELKRMRDMINRNGMYLADKSAPNTFFNGTNGTYPPSNLDHVFASDSISILNNEIQVLGWPQADDPDQWIKDFSDHAILYFEVGG